MVFAVLYNSVSSTRLKMEGKKRLDSSKTAVMKITIYSQLTIWIIFVFAVFTRASTRSATRHFQQFARNEESSSSLCWWIERFHMTSRRPYWCPKPILWKFNSFLMQTLSFVSINLHRCWPRDWKHYTNDTVFCSYRTTRGWREFPIDDWQFKNCRLRFAFRMDLTVTKIRNNSV